MADLSYSYREYLRSASSTVYPTGTTGNTNWTTTDQATGTATAKYWYTDSNRTDWQHNYSRVYVDIEDDWTASVDNYNNLTVTLTSIITSITRSGIVGTPTTTTTGRDISIYREQGGTRLFYTAGDQIGTAHTIATNINLGTVTFTLAPGQNATRSSVYYHNYSPADGSYDDLWMGIELKNTLPADYRPMMVRDPNGAWLSCNRTGGKLNIRKADGTMKELRTINGNGVTTGDPPSIYSNGAYRNQRKIGQGA